MINKVIIMGRITHDLEIRQSQGGIAVLSFTVAVERGYVKQGEERQTDFINCVAWRQQAEFIGKYFSKGRMIAIEGNLRTRTYDDKNGTKRYVTEVFVDNVSFTGEKVSGGQLSDSNYSSSYSKPSNSKQSGYNEPSDRQITIGDLDDFEEILGDGSIPF